MSKSALVSAGDFGNGEKRYCRPCWWASAARTRRQGRASCSCRRRPPRPRAGRCRSRQGGPATLSLLYSVSSRWTVLVASDSSSRIFSSSWQLARLVEVVEGQLVAVLDLLGQRRVATGDRDDRANLQAGSGRALGGRLRRLGGRSGRLGRLGRLGGRRRGRRGGRLLAGGQERPADDDRRRAQKATPREPMSDMVEILLPETCVGGLAVN